MENKTEIDKALWAELECENPSEGRIRTLVERGAIIKGEFLWDVILDLVPNPDYGGKALDLKFVELLINLGADVNYQNEGSNSLWPASVCIRNSALVELLLRKGANPNCYSKESQSTILSEVGFDERNSDTTDEETKELFKCMDLLKQYGAKTTREWRIAQKKEEQNKPLWDELCSENPRPEKIRELVKGGADISGDFLKDAIFTMIPRRDDDGTLCGKMPDFGIFKLLVELGADVNFEDEDSFNCLFEASLSWSPGLVKLLLDLGANPNSISPCMNQSILDYVRSDRFYEETHNSAGGEKYLGQIVCLLEDCGAKSYSELEEAKEAETAEIDERELLQLVVLFYNEGNIEWIKPVLAPDIVYTSQWVLEKLEGSERFLKYFGQKFESQRMKGWKIDVYAHHLKCGRIYFLIIKQQDSPDEIVAEVRFGEGKLKYIGLFPRVKDPLTFQKTSFRFEAALELEKMR